MQKIKKGSGNNILYYIRSILFCSIIKEKDNTCER